MSAMITNVLGTMTAGTMGKTVTSAAFSRTGEHSPLAWLNQSQF
jgi:hypothetical protein